MSSRRPRNRRLCPLSESGRSPPISGLRRRHQASRDSNYLLRGRPAHLESGSPHPAGYRQRADGDSSRSGEGPEGSLRHAVTPAAGNPTRLVARGKAPSVALPRRHPGTTHRQECRGTGVSKGPPRCPIPKPTTPHSLRHALEVHLLESGTNLRTIQLLLGHRSLATTTRYLRMATCKVCSTNSPLDLLPGPTAIEPPPTAPHYF